MSNNDFHKRSRFQFFAGEGAGDGGGEATGAATPDAGVSELLALGVPEDRARRFGSMHRAAQSAPATQPPTAEQTTPEGATESQPEQHARPTLKQLLKDNPDYNTEMQGIIKSRLGTEKSAAADLRAIDPALDLLYRKYGLDRNASTIQDLADRISGDTSYYEDMALEQGKTVEEVMAADQQSRQQQREQAAQKEQQLHQHFDGLVQQGEALKQKFPGFNLDQELQNPDFVRLTAPGEYSVEKAFQFVHMDELLNGTMQATTQAVQRSVAQNISAGMARPVEHGTSAQAPSTSTFDPTKMTPEQRASLRERIMRGEYILPGHEFT